jgi:hypothetical protein
MKLSNTAKNVIVALIVVAVVAYLAFFLRSEPEPFDKGTEINQETFMHLLEEADTIYIVMDIRNVSDSDTKKNILQCGVDFASSTGLVGRKVRYMALDPDEGCILGDFDETEVIDDIPLCLSYLNDGVSLYVTEGYETKYYTRAAMVGVGQYYNVGTCDISYS